MTNNLGYLGVYPITTVTPFSYRSGATMMEIMERFKQWAIDMGPEVQSIVDESLTLWQAEFDKLEVKVDSKLAEWQALFNDFVADIIVELEALNDIAITNLVKNETSLLNEALTEFVSKQIFGPSKMHNRMYPTALAKIKAIYSCSIEEPVYNIFLGSSTTNGAFSSENMHYPAQITQKIGDSLPSKVDPVLFTMTQANSFNQWVKPGLHMANAGQGGMTAQTMYAGSVLTSVANILSDSRGVVNIMIGSNDQNYGHTPDSYRDSIQAVIDDIKTKAKKGCAFILIHSFSRADKISYDYPWEDYLNALQVIADADPSNVMLIDLDKHYKHIDVMGADPFGFGSGDLVHNNEKSHTFTADWLGKYLELTPYNKRPNQSISMFDTFTDSDGVSAITHKPESWTAEGGTSKSNPSMWEYATGSSGFEISNNRLSSTGESGFLYTETNDSDHEVSAEIVYGSPGVRSVFARFNADDNSRFNFYVSGTRLVLSRINTTGGFSELMRVPVEFTPGEKFTLTMRVIGRKIECKFDGKLVISYTLPENLYAIHLGQTKAGVSATGIGEIYEGVTVTPLSR